MTLLVQWYRSSNAARMREIDHCAKANVANRRFGRVVVFVPREDEAAARASGLFADARCELVVLSGRLTYADALSRATDPGRVYVLINSDIVVPAEAAAQICRRLSGAGRPVSICLTRWESSMTGAAPPQLPPRCEITQDLWAFRGGASITHLAPGCRFPLGVPGCDHRIAWSLSKVSEPCNPCRTIRTLHIHASRHRTYSKADRLPPPYLYMPPCA
jgi:hypothetical protein